MAVSAEDRLAISELIALHGHIVDSAELDRLEDLFSPEVTYDLGDFGLGTLQGIDAIRNAAIAMGDRNPVGHHVTNIILTEVHGRVVWPGWVAFCRVRRQRGRVGHARQRVIRGADVTRWRLRPRRRSARAAGGRMCYCRSAFWLGGRMRSR
jgi:SnoaL-like domain